MIMPFQSLCLISKGTCLVTLSSTSVKSYELILSITASLYISNEGPLTETKKLEVPSARANTLGNNFSQVSSPYMTNLPSGLSFNCESQVSWLAKLEVVSDSAKLRMTSRKEGIDPVVIALTRGMVIVGDVAWAVNGMAAPNRIRLPYQSQLDQTVTDVRADL